MSASARPRRSSGSARHQGLPVPVPRRRCADLHGQGQLRAGHAPDRPARRCRRIPPGRHGRGHGALQRAGDLGAVARYERGRDRRSRRGGEGADRLLLLQARDPRQWRARDGPAAHQRRHPHRRRRPTSRPTSAGRTDLGQPFRPHHDHDSRGAQGGARGSGATMAKSSSSRSAARAGRLRHPGRRAGRGDSGRGAPPRPARLGSAARGRRRGRGRSQQAALDRRSDRRAPPISSTRSPISRSRSRSRSRGPAARVGASSPRGWSTIR